MIRLLTEEIIFNIMEDVHASSESEEMKGAEMMVLEHCLNCLKEGKILTIDSEGKIKLYEMGKQLN